MPKKSPNGYKPNLSVCVISLNDESILDELDIWNMGCIIAAHSNRIGKLKARADINIDFVNQTGLIVEVNCIPIKEHANIKPFPKSEIACQRLATDLALNSQLKIK